MNIFAKNTIKLKLKEDREVLRTTKEKLQKETESLCLSLGGHEFWPWQEKIAYSIGGDMLYSHIRVCAYCGRKEYKKDTESEGE